MSIEKALGKLRAAQMCHPNAVQALIDEAIAAIQQAEAQQPATGEPVEMSPAFTDTARAALIWVLWHHQGGSSPVGQPIRYALGMGAHDRLSAHHVNDAKRWASITGAQTGEFRTHQAPSVPANALHIIGWWLCNEANPQDGSPWATEPSQLVLDHMKVVSGEKHAVMRLVAIDAAMLAAKTGGAP